MKGTTTFHRGEEQMETEKPTKEALLAAIHQAPREEQLAALERLLRLGKASPGKVFSVLHAVLVGGKDGRRRASP